MPSGPEQAQVDYYRARAGEYDDFWHARGLYAKERDVRAQWLSDTGEAERQVARWLADGPGERGGHVLELACGTGIWTRLLVDGADRVTALDSSPEMIALNREKVGARHVDYEVADLFRWDPDGRSFDAVFMGYWHSHVPDERLADFWSLVQRSLVPGGRVMLVDSASYPPQREGDDAAVVERRVLKDGVEYHVVKRYWSPAKLCDHLAGLGWRADARTTANGMILLAEMGRL